MANHNVQWTTSSKGQNQLVVDDYIFFKNGKGKIPGFIYWICSSPGCKVNAKTNGNQLVSVTNIVNPPDHGHVNSNSYLSALNSKVSSLVLIGIFLIEFS
jgi:hypothetical protein